MRRQELDLALRHEPAGAARHTNRSWSARAVVIVVGTGPAPLISSRVWSTRPQHRRVDERGRIACRQAAEPAEVGDRPLTPLSLVVLELHLPIVAEGCGQRSRVSAAAHGSDDRCQ